METFKPRIPPVVDGLLQGLPYDPIKLRTPAGPVPSQPNVSWLDKIAYSNLDLAKGLADPNLWTALGTFGAGMTGGQGLGGALGNLASQLGQGMIFQRHQRSLMDALAGALKSGRPRYE